MSDVAQLQAAKTVVPEALPPVFATLKPVCTCALNDPIAAAFETQFAAQAANDAALMARDKGLPDAASDMAGLKSGKGTDMPQDDGAPLVYNDGWYIAAAPFQSALSASEATSFVSVSEPEFIDGYWGEGHYVTASFQGTSDKYIWVSSALADATAATEIAQQVAHAVGQVPLAFLDYVTSINIHGNTGNGSAFQAAYWSNDLNVYSGLGSNGIEESLIHEFGHLVIDEMIAYDPALRESWQAAQDADGIFISRYAEDFANREDAAESLLIYILVRVYPDRLDPERVAEFELTFQNRFAFFDSLDIDYSTAGRDVSFQANNNYFHYDPDEAGGFWETSSNLLTNDYDVSGEGLRVVAIDGMGFDTNRYLAFAGGGSVWVDSNGQIDFDAGGSFDDMLGGDRETRSFTYTVENTAGAQDTATVTLIVDRPAQAVAAGGTETFETRASDWTDNTTTFFDGNGYLGGFDGSDRVEKTYRLGADAISARIGFDFLEIDSWDRESFTITINGQEINLGTFAWNVREGATSYTVDGITIAKTAESALPGYGNQDPASWFSYDGMHSFVITVDNPGEALTVGFSANLSSDVSDESWGIDNITVTPTHPDPVLSISADTSTVPEGDAGTTTNLAFTVSLSGPSAVDITADIAIAGNASGASALVIPAGATSVPLVVSITGDDVVETDETITVTLSSLTGAQAGTLTATQTVLNDDAPPNMTLIAPEDVAEGDAGEKGQMIFTAQLDSASKTTVTADVILSGAVTGPSTVTFAPGQTSAEIVLDFAGDNNADGSEDITVSLSNLQNAIGTDLTATATILGDDVLTFDQSQIGFYGGNVGNVVGPVSVSPDGGAVTLDGNVWATISMPLDVTADTVMRFDLNARDTGEILGLMFETDTYYDGANLFKLGGSQNWSGWIGDFNGYQAGSGTVSYEIRVGDYVQGSFDRLVLIGDDDADASTSATFSNIRFVEELPAPIIFGDSRYELGTSGLTWEQAKTEATEKGGKIVEINSAAENDFIFNTFDGANNPIWLGFDDKITEGVYLDSAGDEVIFTNWLDGQPNNGGTYGNQDYAVMGSSDGKWNDTTNTETWFFDERWTNNNTNLLVIEYDLT